MLLPLILLFMEWISRIELGIILETRHASPNLHNPQLGIYWSYVNKVDTESATLRRTFCMNCSWY